jgi:CelD/BcsL family acetyltransferase involved in cellulose biosynthesis
MSPTFERIEPGLSDWGRILNEFQDRTIFQTPAWLAFLAKTQRAEPVFAALKDGTRTVGYFSGLIVTRCGLRILGSPLPGWTTSYMGMNLLRGVPRSSGLVALQQLAFDRLHCVHLELMDRNLSFDDVKDLGFEQRRFTGFEVDLTKSEDELWKTMTSACRRCIRRAHDRGVIIEEAHDMEFADEYHAQLQEVFRKRSLIPPYGVDRVRELVRSLSDSGQLLLLRARDPMGRGIATGIFPASHDTMYFWGGASWKDSLLYRPNEAIQWYAMKYWRARGIRRYDMGGGGQYKKKFGGCEIAIPWIRKSKYPGVASLRRLVKYAFERRQKWLGHAEQLAEMWT